jgi:hypothetical protein
MYGRSCSRILSSFAEGYIPFRGIDRFSTMTSRGPHYFLKTELDSIIHHVDVDGIPILMISLSGK